MPPRGLCIDRKLIVRAFDRCKVPSVAFSVEDERATFVPPFGFSRSASGENSYWRSGRLSFFLRFGRFLLTQWTGERRWQQGRKQGKKQRPRPQSTTENRMDSNSSSRKEEKGGVLMKIELPMQRARKNHVIFAGEGSWRWIGMNFGMKTPEFFGQIKTPLVTIYIKEFYKVILWLNVIWWK